MKEDVKILIAEDDPGHATLLIRNLRRAGVQNNIERFHDGQEILDFLFDETDKKESKKAYLLLLDIRMPKVDGIEVLAKIKANDELRKLPVIVLSTNDSADDIAKCYELGCSNYLIKPIEYNNFVDVLKYLGLFLTIVEVP